MAKNKSTTSSTTSNYSVVKATAFWGIIIAGIAGLISVVVKILLAPDWAWLDNAANALNTVASIMNLIAELALLVSAIIAGYEYSKGKNQTLRILFIIFAVLALLAVLGFNIISMF